jgi:hypothetical protein
MAGYSGTPLVQKLGIKPLARVTFPNAPDHFATILGPLPEGVCVLGPGYPGGKIDWAVLFCRSRAELEQAFPGLSDTLNDNGALWVAWPKKAAKVATDLTEDVVRAVGLAGGMVDVKVCAIDETWSGLKFVFRLEDRARRSAPPKTGKRDEP